MGALIATLLGAYTIAKVQRDAMFLAEFGALALPYAYVGVALASAAFVWLEGRMARRFTRLGASRWNRYAAITISLASTFAFALEPRWTSAAFFIWTGSQAMMLLPHYWVLALDVWNPRRARRVFPVLSGFGLLGGVLGGGFAGLLTPLAQRIGLTWTLTGLLVLAHLLTRSIERHRTRQAAPPEAGSGGSRWEIIRRSNYLRYLAVALALSVVVSTLVDFQFKLVIQDVFRGAHELTVFLGKFYLVLNGLALLFQFGVAGWLLSRLGVAATGLQPALVVVFSWWVALSTGWWAVVALRWVQGVVLQGIGKSSAEIYYMAVSPPERRRIKPAVDTLVERWADAVVGVFLIVLLHATGIALELITLITMVLAAGWLLFLVRLNRQYARAFEQAMSRRWLEPEGIQESLRVPAARRALLHAVRSGEEPKMALALELCMYTRDRELAHAIREALRHPSPAVRSAAVRAMEGSRIRDPDRRVDELLRDPEDRMARAAVSYFVAMSPRPDHLVRELLEGSDSRLRELVLDVLLERPHEAPHAVRAEWVDARMESGRREDLLLAARALGAMPGPARVGRMRRLLRHEDPDVQRTALVAAARRPHRELLDLLIPRLLVPELSYEARFALAALGSRAVPELERLLEGREGLRAQALAARTLAQIATPRALKALLRLARSSDLTLRHLGIQNASRARLILGQPLLTRSQAHKLFLRELREYRAWIAPSRALAYHPAPEVRLLAESSREFAEMALERGFRALACWYEPRPLSGAYERVKSRDPVLTAPALEYLGHMLPRAIFQHVSSVFEEGDPGGREPAGGEQIARWIWAAWRSGDAWLRACAVRASRWASGVDPELLSAGGDRNPIVQQELDALRDGGRPVPSWLVAAGASPC